MEPIINNCIFFVTEDNKTLVQKIIENDEKYIETVPFRIAPIVNTVKFYFLSVDEKNINYAVLVSQGKRNKKDSVIKSQLSFYSFLKVVDFPIHSLQSKLVDQGCDPSLSLCCLPLGGYQDSYNKYEIEGSIWLKLIGLVKESNDDLRKDIEQMILKTNEKSIEGAEYSIMSHQKDTLQLSLNLAGINTNVEFKTNKKIIGKPENYFPLVKDKRQKEDNLIVQDLFSMELKFRNWFEDEKKKKPDTRTFVQGEHRLTITNVNRDEYERVLGVDFLFYNHTFNLFMMVQYKVWEQDEKGYIYRRNSQYKKDIERMNGFKEMFKNSTLLKSVTDYRLDPLPFYFKLCHPTQLRYDNQLVSGIYVPAEYLEYCLQEKAHIRIKDIPHGFHNELFIDLIKKGLIGSRGVDELTLETIVDSLLAEKRSVTLAETNSVKKYKN